MKRRTIVVRDKSLCAVMIGARMPRADYDKLDKYAAKRKVTKAQVVAEALEAYIKDRGL